jgi:hypothetical protein
MWLGGKLRGKACSYRARNYSSTVYEYCGYWSSSIENKHINVDRLYSQQQIEYEHLSFIDFLVTVDFHCVK